MSETDVEKVEEVKNGKPDLVDEVVQAVTGKESAIVITPNGGGVDVEFIGDTMGLALSCIRLRKGEFHSGDALWRETLEWVIKPLYSNAQEHAISELENGEWFVMISGNDSVVKVSRFGNVDMDSDVVSLLNFINDGG